MAVAHMSVAHMSVAHMSVAHRPWAPCVCGPYFVSLSPGGALGSVTQAAGTGTGVAVTVRLLAARGSQAEWQLCAPLRARQQPWVRVQQQVHSKVNAWV